MTAPDQTEDIRYILYSAHDWTVSQHLLFLDATNGNFTNLPFASQVNYELHSTDNCSDSSCFWVEVYYNDVAQIFDGDCAIATQCTYDEFLAMLDRKGFTHTTTHYVDECATPWSPPNASEYVM